VAHGNLLQRDWRHASLSIGRTDPASWWTPAVDAVADGIGDRLVDLPAACAALGRQRAEAGVFLDEARADLLVAATIASLPQPMVHDLLDALTLGWVESMLDLHGSSCVDPLTELTSIDYLTTRLAEIHAEARLDGRLGCDTHVLVVVQIARTPDPMVRETHLITVQTALRSAFRGGETLARIGAHCAVAVAGRAPERLHASLASLRTELAIAERERRLSIPRIWLESIPADLAVVPALLREICG
jgi:GGDEF domain-containing protein